MGLLLPGLGAITGAFAGSPAGRTTTTSGTQTGTNYGTSSTSQNLTPGQQGLSDSIYPLLQQMMTPAGAEATIAPYTAASRDATNSTYAGLANMLRSQFLSTGNGQSGKFGTALVQGNLQRLGALQGVDTTGQEEAAALPLQAESIASGLLEHPFGSTTTSSGGSSSTSSGTSVGPGSPLIDALMGGTSALAGESNQANAIIAALLKNGD